jgi:hypothetical protein
MPDADATTMTMLSVVAGVLVAAALLSWRARVRGPGLSIGTAAVVAVAAILTFDALSSFWGRWTTLRDERTRNAALVPADAATRPGAAAGASVAFVEWLNGVIPRGAPYYVATNGSDPANYQWLLFRLYPRVAVDSASRARWVVFVRETPAAAGFHPADLVRYMRFTPDLAVGERRP